MNQVGRNNQKKCENVKRKMGETTGDLVDDDISV
jgi:hypothetical protein